MNTSELPWKILEEWHCMVVYDIITYSNKLFMQKNEPQSIPTTIYKS